MKIELNKCKITLILIAITFSMIYSCKQSTSTKTSNPSGFQIKRGVNLSHWLSQDFGWAPKYTLINENDIRLIEVFKSGIEFAKSKNLQLYCGEFGCLLTVDRTDRLLFYSDMVAELEENNIAWCNWEYKGDFGIYHFDMEKKISLSLDFELIEILLQTK